MKTRFSVQPPSSSPGLSLSSLLGRTYDATRPFARSTPTSVTLAPASPKRDCNVQRSPNADAITTVDLKTAAEFDRSPRSTMPAQAGIATSAVETPVPQTNRSKRPAAEREFKVDLEQPGLLRLKEVLDLLRISRSGWYAGLQRGQYPPPVKLAIGPRTRAVRWKKSDLLALLQKLDQQSQRAE